MDRREAIAFFQRKADADPMDADAHLQLSALFRGEGDAARAARHARIAWLTQRGGPAAWNEHALALMGAQETQDEAWRLLRAAMARWPRFAGSFSNAAALLARRGRYAEALPYCLRAAQLSPGDAAAHRNAARVCEALGRASEAERHARRAMALAPDDAALAQRLALMSLARSGGRADATAFYARYRSLAGAGAALPP